MQRINIAVFASGSGTNFQAIVDAEIKAANLTVLVCNNPNAYAIKRAEKHGIPVELVNHKDFDTREEFEHQVITRLRKYEIGLVVLAGFMRVLTPFFVSRFKNRIINIHPALLPSFPGVSATKQAIDYGAKLTGCTVHFVDDGVDTGPIILQSAVPVEDNDTEDSLLSKIHAEEHRIFPQAVQLFCEGKLSIEGRKVIKRN